MEALNLDEATSSFSLKKKALRFNRSANFVTNKKRKSICMSLDDKQ